MILSFKLPKLATRATKFVVIYRNTTKESSNEYVNSNYKTLNFLAFSEKNKDRCKNGLYKLGL
jgi:hypothetical protein